MPIQYFFILGFAPGVFWLAYFYRRDKLEKEPKSLILKSFLLGILLAVPASLLESIFFINRFLVVVVTAPIVEELLKFLAIRFYCFPKDDFNEPMDGIMYGAAVALGFASIENVGYLVSAHSHGLLNMTFFMRAIFSVPGHALFTCMGGYALGMRKVYPEKVGGFFVFKGLLIAMALHAAFNGIASANIFLGFGLLVFIPLAWVLLNKRISHALQISPFATEKDKES